jgi:hypothetical protein
VVRPYDHYHVTRPAPLLIDEAVPITLFIATLVVGRSPIHLLPEPPTMTCHLQEKERLVTGYMMQLHPL